MVKKNCGGCWIERPRCPVTRPTFRLAAANSYQQHGHLTDQTKQNNNNNNKNQLRRRFNLLISCQISSKTSWEVAAFRPRHTHLYWYVRKVQHKHRKKNSIAIINRHFHRHLCEQKGYNRPRYASNMHHIENRIFNDLTDKNIASLVWSCRGTPTCLQTVTTATETSYDSVWRVPFIVVRL